MAINQSQLFNNVPDEKIHINDYDLSFDNICTTEIGRNTVLFCRRVLPGEYWKMHLDMFVRTMPLVSPVYGKMDLYAHSFFCTNRSLSDIWENYIRNGEDGEHYDPNDPATSPFMPDLLKVSNNNGDYDYRNPLNPEAVAYVSCHLMGYQEPEFIYEEFLKHPEERAPFTHGSLFDYLNVNSTWRNSDVILSLNEIASYPSSGVEDYFEDYNMLPFKYSLLPFKAYQAIWSEYYADANVMTFDDMDTIDFRWMTPINSVHVSADPDLFSVTALTREGLDYPLQYSDFTICRNLFKTRYRCYAKDYFTSSLPEPQRGPDVLIPMDAEIEILNRYNNDSTTEVSTISSFGDNAFLGIGSTYNPGEVKPLVAGGSSLNLDNDGSLSSVSFNGSQQVRIYNAQQLRAEISSLSATITDLRTAVALQEFYESSARYGNRYKEFVYGHFGSMIPDDQLTRPWYLGGIKIPIQISDVMQTSPNSDGLGVGDMAGKGVSATNDNNFLFERQFDDYGLIMVILSIRPHNYYKNTILKEWTIEDRLDEYWRKLQSVGEEEVATTELTGLTFDPSIDQEQLSNTFGYQMRYSNYKFSFDEVHGDFKGDLSYWTMCRDFSKGVALSKEFLEIKPQEFNHIFQYSGLDTDHFLINSHFNIVRSTPMDIYSIPRIN